MNLRLVLSFVGRIIKFEGMIMLLPLVVVLYFNEPAVNAQSFILAATATFIVGEVLSRSKYDIDDMHAAEGFAIVALSWIALSLFGCLPLLISGEFPSFADAFFETASGFSTTGATVLHDVESVSKSILFWRSFTQWLGGMGILVFVLAITPTAHTSRSESVFIMKAEVPGTGFGKLRSRVSSSAQVLYYLYITMTLVTILLLALTSIPTFDAVLMGFGAAATGGFSTMNESIASYDSRYVEIILAFSMLAFGINFNLYYMVLNKQFKGIWRNEELKWYLGIVILSVLLIVFNLVNVGQYAVGDALHDSFFSVSSVMTTTAYVAVDYTLFPIFTRVILMGLMFIGGMSGSTAGGLKVSRLAILLKVVISELKRITYPNRVVSVHYENQAQNSNFIRSVVSYFVVYIFIFVLGIAVVSLEVPDFISSFTTVSAMINNVGTGFGVVGPANNFAFYSQPMKLFLAFLMIAGRLEIYPLLILLSPKLWRHSLKTR